MDKFDEYKFFAESTQFLTERRQNASQIFIGVNAAILAVLGFFVKDVEFQGYNLFFMSLPLMVGGILISFIWYKMIKYYKELIGWRYDQLMIMEKEIDGCYGMYSKEWEDYFKPKQGKERFGFSMLEVWLPRLFTIIYIVYMVGLFLAIKYYWVGGKG